ncbi:MAG TPA: hypothetical protein VM074_04295 [Solimonas sp.]|nr:hypothetical protein [Solimonas sp.]
MKLTPASRWLLMATLSLLYASGLLWLVLHYALATPRPFGPPQHAWEPGVLALHGLLGMAGLVAIGAMLPLHARSGWLQRRNRTLGMMLLTLGLWAAVTGWGLYYAGGEALRAWLPWLHWVPLLPAPLVLVLHRAAARRPQGLAEEFLSGSK